MQGGGNFFETPSPLFEIFIFFYFFFSNLFFYFFFSKFYFSKTETYSLRDRYDLVRN